MLRWRRVFVLGGVLSLLGAVGIGLSLWLMQPMDSRPPPFPSRVATDDEQRQLLKTLVSMEMFRGVPPPPPEVGASPRGITPFKPLVVADTALLFCKEKTVRELPDSACTVSDSMAGAIANPGFALDYEGAPDIPLAFRVALIEANRSPHRIPLPEDRRVLAGSVREFHRLMGAGFWDAFYRRYPDTAGMLHTSRAVVSMDGTQALIYVEHFCEGTCGTGGLYRLTCIDGQWTLQNTFGMWIS
jgi:hypothetical protein